MPILLQKSTDKHTQIGLWKIEEDEAFFLRKVQLQQPIHHPHKRLQHLAGRYLLSLLFPQFPFSEIELNEAGKPYLPLGHYHFSISHCGDYAAVIISTQNQCGIDIELFSPKTEKVKGKFLGEEELKKIEDLQQRYSQSLGKYQLYTLCWCAKEAVYKWWGKGRLDFRRNIIIRNISFAHRSLSVYFAFEDVSVTLSLQMQFLSQLSLVWTNP